LESTTQHSETTTAVNSQKTTEGHATSTSTIHGQTKVKTVETSESTGHGGIEPLATKSRQPDTKSSPTTTTDAEIGDSTAANSMQSNTAAVQKSAGTNAPDHTTITNSAIFDSLTFPVYSRTTIYTTGETSQAVTVPGELASATNTSGSSAGSNSATPTVTYAGFAPKTAKISIVAIILSVFVLL